MTVLFMDGFDFNTQVTGDGLPGLADSIYYYTSPLSARHYVDGYLRGQATQLTLLAALGGLNTKGLLTNSIPQDSTKLRLCMWAKSDVTGFGSRYIGFQCLRIGPNFTDNQALGVYLNEADHKFYFGYGSTDGTRPGGIPTIISQATLVTTTVITTTWTFYETLIDFPNRKMVFFVNGIEQNTATIPEDILDDVTIEELLADGIATDIRSNALNLQVDHFFVTDGDRPKNQSAVAVSAAMGHGTTFRTGGFKSKLVLDGTAYDLLPYFTFDADGYGDGPFGQAHNFLYSTDPRTGLPWTGLSDIEAWGLCAVGVSRWNTDVTDIDDKQYIRLYSLGLSYIDTTTDPLGLPIINYRKPSALTMFSGEWIKMNTALSYGGNVSTIPRPNVDLDEVDNLHATEDGCLIFPPSSGDTIFQDLGMTFAEEYRTDYQDWDSLGVGTPFDSYFITGYSLMGEGQRDFQSNYVTVNYEELAVGQAYLQGIWDYALDGDTGRWSSKQPVYRFPGNYKHQMRKLKVRGSGRALQIKISSEDNKDFKINGWTIFATGDANV